jgi:hypothetical protein
MQDWAAIRALQLEGTDQGSSVWAWCAFIGLGVDSSAQHVSGRYRRFERVNGCLSAFSEPEGMGTWPLYILGSSMTTSLVKGCPAGHLAKRAFFHNVIDMPNLPCLFRDSPPRS